MARDIISVIYPTLDNSQSIEEGPVTASTVAAANGIQIKDALKNKDNSLFIIINNTKTAASTVTFKGGDAYPSAILGDLTLPIAASTVGVFRLQDVGRFENQDGSVNIDFGSNFTGTIYAVAKRAGITPLV